MEQSKNKTCPFTSRGICEENCVFFLSEFPFCLFLRIEENLVKNINYQTQILKTLENLYYLFGQKEEKTPQLPEVMARFLFSPEVSRQTEEKLPQQHFPEESRQTEEKLPQQHFPEESKKTEEKIPSTTGELKRMLLSEDAAFSREQFSAEKTVVSGKLDNLEKIIQHLKKGDDYYHNDNFTMALIEYEEAVKLNPLHVEAWEKLEKIYRAEQRQVMQIYDEALKLKEEGNFKGYIEKLEKAQQLAPKNVLVNELLGKIKKLKEL